MNKKVNKKLLVKHINGELLNESDRIRVDEWLKASKENKSYYNSLKALWFSYELNDLHVTESRSNVWNRIEERALTQEEKNKKTVHDFNWKRAISIAASIIVVVSIGITFYLYNRTDDTEFYKFTADSGSRSKIELVDGTVVYLNSETELLVPKDFGENNRNVKLTGEAYFAVTKTKNKSLFIVEANDLSIKVLGTEFNVKSYPEEGTIETTLEKGKVEIIKRNETENRKIVTLEPNQRAIFVKKEGFIALTEIDVDSVSNELILDRTQNRLPQRQEKLVLKDNIETQLYTSWKDGKLEFESEKFGNLVVRLERWYGIDIKVKTDSIKSVEYTGTFINETLEQALDALKMTLPFNYTMDIEQNIVYIE